jgi:predicted dinucleotide-binding enzyme
MGKIMKKTVIVMGTGAQGGTIAMRLNEEPNIGKIICIMSWTFATEEEIAFYKWLARIFHAHDGFIDKALRNAAVVYYRKFLITQ